LASSPAFPEMKPKLLLLALESELALISTSTPLLLSFPPTNDSLSSNESRISSVLSSSPYECMVNEALEEDPNKEKEGSKIQSSVLAPPSL